MKKYQVAKAFAPEGKWTSGADATMLIGAWQAWVDGDGHWKVRGPDPDNEAHYGGGDIELTEAEDNAAGNSVARRKIRAERAKRAARAYILANTAKGHHSTMKTTKTSKMLSSPVVLSESVAMPLGSATIHIHHGKGGFAGVLVFPNGNELPMSLGVPVPTTAREALRGAKKFLASVYGRSN